MASWVLSYRSQQAAKNMCRALGLESFTTVDVSHGTRCYGVVVKHSDGWSIVYVKHSRCNAHLTEPRL